MWIISKSHREKKKFLMFLQSIHQVDMKNVVKWALDFFPDLKALETNSVQNCQTYFCIKGYPWLFGLISKQAILVLILSLANAVNLYSKLLHPVHGKDNNKKEIWQNFIILKLKRKHLVCFTFSSDKILERWEN